MKNKFANFMLEKDFKSAATLIHEEGLNISTPNNINLTINVDREKSIGDLTEQMKGCHSQISESYSEVSFEKIWSDAFTKPEYSDKQALKNDEIAMKKAKEAYNLIMKRVQITQYEQIFDSTVLTLNATLQGVVNAAAQL